MSTHSNGISALQLQSQLSLGSYEPSGCWPQAAPRHGQPEREPLSVVEADETIIRSAPRRPVVVAAAGRQDAGRRRGRNRRRQATARPAQSDRGLWQAGTSCFVLGAVARKPSGHDDWPSYRTFRCPARRDHPRPMAAHIALPGSIGCFQTSSAGVWASITDCGKQTSSITSTSSCSASIGAEHAMLLRYLLGIGAAHRLPL